MGVAFNVLRVYNGGELLVNSSFWISPAEIHCEVEPTGGYASHANGRAENSIRSLSRVTQCLLFGGGRDPTFWCFAMIHACLLLGIRPRANGITSHEALFGVKPSVDRLVVWNSPGCSSCAN